MSTLSIRCRICDGMSLHPFLDLGKMPIANSFLTRAQLSEPEYTFRLRCGFCVSCRMVQLVEVVEPDMLFHGNYAYFSSISQVMDEHFSELSTIIGEEILYDASLPIVEIGANDGILLQKLVSHNANAIGIEPSANVAAAARDKGLNVISEFFNVELAGTLRAEHGPAQLVVGANVLCHIPDLNGVARALEALLDEEGVFIFEDPYWLEIMAQLAYDQIYDEHVYYFSVSSLKRLFEKHGLRIFRVDPIAVHGGSMRVYGCKVACSRREEPSVRSQLTLENEHGLDSLDTYSAFAARVEQSRDSLRDLLGSLQGEGARLVGYAASSKGTVILNYCGIGPDLLEFVCDNTPSKEGLFTPGTHIPVVSIDRFAADYPDYAFLLAWNHLNEISIKEHVFREHGGRFITHIPMARII